jgi:creatinine amidohydrolase
MSADWRDGHRLLQERLAGLPDALRATAAMPLPSVSTRGLRRVVTTGIGSSEWHARVLAHLLDEHADVPARFVPLSALATTARGDLLVVFSQGLSPNARLALARRSAWRDVVVATAARGPARMAPLAAAGVHVAPFAGENEYGTLVRVVGPATGLLCAARLAAALGARVAWDVDAIAAAVASAGAAVAGVPDDVLAGPLAFVSSGTYASLAGNLALKVMEGLLRPPPPIWDLLHVAHGPFQQAFPGPATFVALTRDDAPEEEALLVRLEAMLDPTRHRVVRLHAPLGGTPALVAHEAQLDVLVLRAIAAAHVDQARWPGRDRDGALYDLAEPPLTRRLEACTWPEVEALVASGRRTAVVPLGSTEQHGPHLPLGTDTWIGDALAERLCAAVDDALACPTLRVGCASEHLAFPGTLDLRPETLEAVLRDVIAALARHGIERVFVFSAHGGNVAPLAAMLPRLAAAGAPVRVTAHTDLARLTAVLHAEAAAGGVSPGAGGHHAGEIETSMLLALRPGVVRTAAMTPGLIVDGADAQGLFYPDLRRHAADGTVGDPCGADPVRGVRYLDAWTAVLVDAYRDAKKSDHTTGVQKT